jgi:ABC-2 type transport system ATP-binding protein
MSHTSAVTLAASALTKSYGTRQAVAGVSLTLKPGEVVGILGPNGAGKSTTISMLAGLVTVDAGQITLNGAAVNAESNAYKKHIGLVTQDIALFEELSALVNCEIFASLYGAHGQVRDERIREVLEEVGLSARANDKVETYSGGMKRRLNIAVALLHNPDIIMLDEPTVGVDPQSRNAIFDNLETLRNQGKAILYSTHYMEEAEKLCDSVVIMDNGRVIANDTVANLKLMLPASDLVDMELSNLTEHSQREKLTAIGELSNMTEHSAHLTVSLKSINDELPALLTKIAAVNVVITHLSTRRAGLEALFLHQTGRQLRDDDSGSISKGNAPTPSNKKANRRIV